MKVVQHGGNLNQAESLGKQFAERSIMMASSPQSPFQSTDFGYESVASNVDQQWRASLGVDEKLDQLFNDTAPKVALENLKNILSNQNRDRQNTVVSMSQSTKSKV
jgi:hypothetical protein